MKQPRSETLKLKLETRSQIQSTCVFQNDPLMWSFTLIVIIFEL